MLFLTIGTGIILVLKQVSNLLTLQPLHKGAQLVLKLERVTEVTEAAKELNICLHWQESLNIQCLSQ